MTGEQGRGEKLKYAGKKVHTDSEDANGYGPERRILRERTATGTAKWNTRLFGTGKIIIKK